VQFVFPGSENSKEVHGLGVIAWVRGGPNTFISVITQYIHHIKKELRTLYGTDLKTPVGQNLVGIALVSRVSVQKFQSYRIFLTRF
jgi:hypothetical protein